MTALSDDEAAAALSDAAATRRRRLPSPTVEINRERRWDARTDWTWASVCHRAWARAPPAADEIYFLDDQPPHGLHVLVTAWTRSPAAFLDALEQAPWLQRLCRDLEEAGKAWQLKDPDGVKIFVAPEIYDYVLNYVRSYSFFMSGKLLKLEDLKRWHLIVGVEFWPTVRSALAALPTGTNIKLTWKTDLFLPVPRWLQTRE